jgi:hypothetical protein
MDLYQQGAAVLGVVVGALLGYLGSALTERARWKRERAARWDEARMKAYADYGEAVKKISHLAVRIAAGRGFPHIVAPMPPTDEALRDLGVAEGERARAWEPVLLLGSADAVTAARSWHTTVWRLVDFAHGQRTDPDAWGPTVTEANNARDKFYDSARRDLGVNGDTVTTPPWEPPSRPTPHPN